jgi:2'-5' RNA ligase
VRLFVALEIPSTVRENLGALLQKLREISAQPRWVRPENLHVTMKFLGAVSPEKIDAIRQGLSSLHSDSPVKLEFRGLGFFPNEKRPRVFWAGMNASPNLKILAADIESAVEKFGIPLGERPFSPHLTLARLQPPWLPEKLRAAIQQDQTREFGTLETRQFQLIESKLKPSGAEYTTLESFTFAGAEG